MESHLKINNLQFSYHKDPILKDININISKGSFVTIIGPNGSGKSTLLKSIAKNILPNNGEIWLETNNILSLSPLEIARKMAVVPQTVHIDFPFSVLETVLMGRTPFLKRFENEGVKDLALAKWSMELTNTWHLRDRSVTEVSGGELQRVVVARALTQEPQIILLDEPTAHLDIQHQMELLELLQSLNKTTGLTVVAVLHDLNLASQFSQEIILMNMGEIYAQGEVNTVLTAENIRGVYEMEVLLVDNPLTGRYNVIPLARSTTESTEINGIHVHLICGGGTGLYILDRLIQLGYQVSCGVLNIGDSDWSRAKKLGLEIVEEAPFAPISEKTLIKNRQVMASAHCIILAPIPFGKGNLPNLSLALEACKEKKPLLIIENNEDYLDQDFTNGEAQQLLQEMKENGAQLKTNPQEIFDFLEKLQRGTNETDC